MSVVIEKADEETQVDENWPEQILQMVRTGGPDALGALEITLLEFALAALHNHRDELHEMGMKAVEEYRTKEKRKARALAKAAIRTGDFSKAMKFISKQEDREKLWGRVADRLGRQSDDPHSGSQGFGRREGMQWVSEHERGGHTVSGYWRERRADEKRSAETEAKLGEERSRVTRELNISQGARADRRETARSGGGFSAIGESAMEPRFRRPFSLEDVSGMTEKFLSTRESEVYNKAIKDGVDAKEKGWLSAVGSVGEALSGSEGRLRFIFRSMREFGPFLGARVAYNYFRRGGYDLPMQVISGKIITETGDEIPEPESQQKSRSWSLERLRSRLPGQQAENSNAEPPSEGFIIDRHGNVLAHAVGRGNDYFLPFSSRHLRRLKNEDGVEYVRRRMYGGPTMEDFHAAMMLGVDRFTVLSNTGEFTVELSARSHGLKLEHVQVLERFRDIVETKGKNLNFSAYESLLEALSSEFPLHIRLLDSTPGDWAERHDRVGPPQGFWAGLADMFGVLSGDNVDRIPKDKRKREDYLPGIAPGESIDHWYFERKRRGENPVGALNQAIRFYREHVNNPSPERINWIRSEIEKLSVNPEMAEQISEKIKVKVPGHTTQDHVDRTEYNRPNFTTGSVTGSINWDQYPSAARVIALMGFNPNSYKNAPRVRRMAEQLQGLPSDVIEELIEGRRTTDIRAKQIEDILFDEFSFGD